VKKPVRSTAKLEEPKTLLGRFLFDLIIVFLGVTLAFGLDDFRQARDEAHYRQSMLAALRVSLADWAGHGAQIDRQVGAMLHSFDEARAQGKKPPLPIYRETGGERPPNRAWDGIIATGAARALDPDLFFRLSRFYSRGDSFGDRYMRYNAFTETRVLPYLGDRAAFYGADGKLKPDYSAYVDRLRDLQREDRALVNEAAVLRDSLPD